MCMCMFMYMRMWMRICVVCLASQLQIAQLAERVSVLVASLQRRCDEDKEDLLNFGFLGCVAFCVEDPAQCPSTT